MTGEAGDWLVSDGHSEWTVSASAFTSTYGRTADGRWRKSGFVRATKLEAPWEVETNEGLASAHEGDWLVTDHTGNAWPVSAAEFNRRYTPADAEG